MVAVVGKVFCPGLVPAILCAYDLKGSSRETVANHFLLAGPLSTWDLVLDPMETQGRSWRRVYSS
jgi:hypothetical protein